MPITPEAASSGAAAALRQRVVVNDVLHHPNWVDYRELARVGDFSACWSEPVIGAHGQLLGTFTAYYRTPARPHEEYLGLVTQGARLTALIIEHLRNAQELSSSLDTFRGIFDSISEALLIQAADHCFLYANASAEQLFGFPYAALVGQTHEFLLPPGLCQPSTSKSPAPWPASHRFSKRWPAAPMSGYSRSRFACIRRTTSGGPSWLPRQSTSPSARMPRCA
jgi:PAS domain-containing protein